MFGFKKELYTPEYQLAGDECAVIETSKGTIKVKFDGEGAPIHVANFCELSTMGFYDGLKFHRYVPGFVIQGGDPNGDGTGDAGYTIAGVITQPDRPGGPGYCIKGEFATNPRNSHVDGALAMARSMDPDSAGSQFYFCLGAQHNLDSGYTVFGTTVEGLDVISQLRAGDEIVHVEIVHE